MSTCAIDTAGRHMVDAAARGQFDRSGDEDRSVLMLRTDIEYFFLRVATPTFLRSNAHAAYPHSRLVVENTMAHSSGSQTYTVKKVHKYIGHLGVTTDHWHGVADQQSPS